MNTSYIHSAKQPIPTLEKDAVKTKALIERPSAREKKTIILSKISVISMYDS